MYLSLSRKSRLVTALVAMTALVAASMSGSVAAADEGQEVYLRFIDTTSDPRIVVSEIATTPDSSAYLVGQHRPEGVQGDVTDGTGWADGLDAYVARYDPTGALQRTQTFGGSLADSASNAVVGADGSLYVSGWTDSLDFPTTPGAYSSEGRRWGGFVTKFSPDGNVVYSTTFPLGIRYMDVDDRGRVHFTSSTYRNPGIITPGAFDSVKKHEEPYVGALSADGSELVYGTYLGGSYQDFPTGIAAEPDGSVFVIGTTRGVSPMSGDAPDFPTTPGAFDPTGFPNDYDVFLTKFDPHGNVVFSTLFGGTRTPTRHSGDTSQGISLAPGGDVYIVGDTTAWDLPTTAGAHDNSYDGRADGFLARFSGTGELVFSTYIGGSTSDGAEIVDTDRYGDAYVAGFTNSKDFKMPDGTTSYLAPGYLAKFTPEGTLRYASSFGNNMMASELVVDSVGTAYVIGFKWLCYLDEDFSDPTASTCVEEEEEQQSAPMATVQRQRSKRLFLTRRVVQCTIRGTKKAEVLRGTRRADVICGGRGRDVIKGRGGSDVIIGGPGNDRLLGGERWDTILGGAGRDRLLGGEKRDLLRGGGARDRLKGGDGGDRLDGGAGPDALLGSVGRDSAQGGPDRDRLLGGPGSDQLNGGGGNDRLLGGGGRDVLRGGGRVDLCLDSRGSSFGSCERPR